MTAAPATPATAAPFAALVRNGGHGPGHYALVLATTAAALGRPAMVFATDEGLALLRADAPLEADPREALLAARGVATVAVLLAAARDLGVRLVACEAGMRAESLDASGLAVGVEVAGAATLLGFAGGAGQVVAL